MLQFARAVWEHKLCFGILGGDWANEVARVVIAAVCCHGGTRSRYSGYHIGCGIRADYSVSVCFCDNNEREKDWGCCKRAE